MNSVAPNLSGDSLIQSLRSEFEKVPDHRNPLGSKQAQYLGTDSADPQVRPSIEL